jgi:hypothetical protein
MRRPAADTSSFSSLASPSFENHDVGVGAAVESRTMRLTAPFFSLCSLLIIQHSFYLPGEPGEQVVHVVRYCSLNSPILLRSPKLENLPFRYLESRCLGKNMKIYINIIVP